METCFTVPCVATGKYTDGMLREKFLVVFKIQFNEKNENMIPSTWMVRWQDSGWGEPQASATDSSCTEVSIATTVPTELLRSKIALPFKLPTHCSLV